LTDLQTLRSYSSEPRGDRTFGTTHTRTTTSSGVIVEIKIEGIAILRGLPRILFGAVAAHEVGHAWLRAMGIDGLKPLEEEGFCELLGYSWLREADSPERAFYAERLASNTDPIYGDGFRHLRGLFEIHGLSGLLNHLRTHKQLPI
jgi:hypothetical protein